MPIPITGLPAQVVPGDNDPLAIVDSAGAITKKITRANLLAGAPLPANTVTTVGVANGSITFPKLGSGATRIGIQKKNTTGTILSNTYTTYLTLTGASTGKECEVSFSAILGNADSGSSRYAQAKVQCDGVDITPINIEQFLFHSPGSTTNFNLAFTVSSTPSAGNHIWTLQFLAGQASTVALGYAVMTVREIS